MFTRAIISALLLIALLSVGSYQLFLIPRPSDLKEYQALTQKNAELRSCRALERSPAHQRREGVQKDLWIVSAEERLHFRIQSAYSDLTLLQRKGKFDVVERLKQIECVFQETIDRVTNTQEVRTLSSQEGIYTFPAHSFSTHEASLAFYQLKGSDLPASFEKEQPYLTGVAQEALFGATTKAPSFTAYHLQAKLHR